MLPTNKMNYTGAIFTSVCVCWGGVNTDKKEQVENFLKSQLIYLLCRSGEAPAILNSNSPNSRATRIDRTMLGGASTHAIINLT